MTDDKIAPKVSDQPEQARPKQVTPQLQQSQSVWRHSLVSARRPAGDHSLATEAACRPANPFVVQ